ncbi:MAG TPA: tetratricopeptide repeat protein [Candidatus Acidoferrum sp.]|nr:tetratricopeptide repeat protein [Candidatus Acidoferrum sp.]
MEPVRRNKGAVRILLALVAVCALLTACSRREQDSPERAQGAKAQFDSVTKEFHVPSAAVNGAERLRLQNEATSHYLALVKKFPEQSNVCAQALRSIGNIRAAQTNLDAAVKVFARVGDDYPTQDWEVLQAWKTAADLLWENGRKPEAQKFYSQIVARFDRAEESAIVKMVVRGSKGKLKE